MNDNFNLEDDDVVSVEFGDPKPMGYCAVCATAPCNANNPDNVAYFGVCPNCHQTDGYICVGANESDTEIGRVAVLLCRVHKTCWEGGYKAFSSWRDETVEQQKALQAELGFWSDYNLVEPVCCTREAIDESSRGVCVHRITAKDLAIERTLDQRPEWSLSDVCDKLGLSRERAQFIITRRIAAKMAAGATLVNKGSSRLKE